MGHYWSEMRPDPTPEELEQEKCLDLSNKLRKLPASHFTIEELALIMRVGWSDFKENYYQAERKQILAIAKREDIK